ncbi:peptidoglycan D,D-transpeptidase FtsI family protein [Hyphomonas jannaschiana]|uniref:Putative penicillin-binding protein 2 n=1 Tax=Hyphomonas jannaschiana VP2 TaxID=1280952 RepID=A0A059FKZ7_9PROT|nr:penicillin-binding protein 2 [Hyphomonas jannaschiana]KCZ91287.1 putative penicillin-binding protein 2 [Hyphomonas jannaschiana VP2]
MTEASRHRTRLVGLGLSALFVVLAGKAGYLALSPDRDSGGYAARAGEQIARADIVDRNGEQLATSVSVYSLVANPQLIWDPREVATRLAGVLPDLDADSLTSRLSDQSREFVWVKRGLTPRQRQTVFDLGLEGLWFKEEISRAYPRGTLAGQVLGFVNIDGVGAGGIEFSQNDRLAAGGEPLRLTIDNGVQAAVEAELAASAAADGFEGAAVILLEARTGEVRAMASWPPFNPNRSSDIAIDDPSRMNRATGALYELGSVFKPLTVAAALEAGAIRPTDMFDVHDPIEMRGYTISDLHPIGTRVNVTTIIAESSNIGTVHINQKLGPRRQQDFLKRAGLLDRSPVELAGSAAPILPERMDDLTAATMAYGHGIAVTPMTFLSAFAAFANGGERVTPTLIVDETRKPQPVRVMSAITADLVNAMMREAVLTGTGKNAEVAGYRVAGKTGTAEKPVPGGYDDGRNISSFAAIFPYDSPQYAMIVTLDDPKAGPGGSVASQNAAPTAGRIIERVAPLLGIAPRFEDLRPAGDGYRARSDERTSL